MAKSDTKLIVAENLSGLLQWAGDRKLPYASPKALAKRARLSHMTIYRMLDGGGAQIDTLEAVAEVFRLRAWQLMIPNLNPSNPPSIPYTPEEQRLYERIGKVLKAVEQDDSEPEGQSPSTDAHPESPGGRQTRGATSRPRKSKAAP